MIQPALADGVTEPADYDGNTEEVDLNMPVDGTVSRATLAFPSGANQSIGIGVDGVNQESLVPFGPSGTNYIALDDTTSEFDLDYEVQNNETIKVRFINARVAETEAEIDDLTAYASGIIVVTEEV